MVKEEQQLTYEHSGDVLINSDKQIIRNICNNLLSNAIKYTPEKGVIKLETHLVNEKTKHTGFRYRYWNTHTRTTAYI